MIHDPMPVRSDMTDQLAPYCPRCHRRHLADLPCWKGKYSASVTAYVLETQGTVCWLCGKAGADTADHITPRSQCGTDDPDNLRPAHLSPCNSRRGDRDPFTPDPDPQPTGVGLSPRWRTT